MTATLPRSLNSLAFAALAILGTAASFGVTTAPARAATVSFYEAQLVTPAEAKRTAIQNGVVWKCGDTDCRGSEGQSRPEVVCARLVRKVGPLAGFSVKGEALDAEALARCNGEKTAPLARR